MMATEPVGTAPSAKVRNDALALWIGILFAVLLTAAIWWSGSRIPAGVTLLPDQGVSWYYWKLPNPTFWSRFSVWSLYGLHQLANWGLIWYAQRTKTRYTTGLHPVNWWALGVNGLFALLHFIQTGLYYDGLAQDVSIYSSQFSVIFLLVFVLMMENPRRGLFFGKPAPLGADVVRFVRQYHGYFFSWAILYTFWYHPMVSTSGHLYGFFYTLLLMLQGSLFFTRVHLNKWWTLAQEMLVLAHGAMVAFQQGKGMWPMFAFGFGGIFVITQMYGLDLRRWQRWAILTGYCALALLVYQDRLPMIHQVTWIPLIDYLFVFLFTGLISLGLWIVRKVQGRRSTAA